MRLFDPTGGDGLLDLSLITGDRFFARNADHFRRYSSGDAGREALVRDVPCKFNLIPWNPFPGAESRPNEPSECVLPRTPLKKWNHLLLH